MRIPSSCIPIHTVWILITIFRPSTRVFLEVSPRSNCTSDQDSQVDRNGSHREDLQTQCRCLCHPCCRKIPPPTQPGTRSCFVEIDCERREDRFFEVGWHMLRLNFAELSGVFALTEDTTAKVPASRDETDLLSELVQIVHTRSTDESGDSTDFPTSVHLSQLLFG